MVHLFFLHFWIFACCHCCMLCSLFAWKTINLLIRIQVSRNWLYEITMLLKNKVRKRVNFKAESKGKFLKIRGDVITVVSITPWTKVNRTTELSTNKKTLKSKISSNAVSSKQSSKLQSRKQSKHENKRLLPDQQIVHPPQGGGKTSKGPKGHQKRSQSNPAIQNHFQQQKFFSRHQSKRPSVQQSPHLQVISLSACLFSPRHLEV